MHSQLKTWLAQGETLIYRMELQAERLVARLLYVPGRLQTTDQFNKCSQK